MPPLKSNTATLFLQRIPPTCAKFQCLQIETYRRASPPIYTATGNAFSPVIHSHFLALLSAFPKRLC